MNHSAARRAITAIEQDALNSINEKLAEHGVFLTDEQKELVLIGIDGGISFTLERLKTLEAIAKSS